MKLTRRGFGGMVAGALAAETIGANWRAFGADTSTEESLTA